jgi:hypothetical protein
MKDVENVTAYLLHVNEIFNTIRGLGEIFGELKVVHKVLRSLPSIFDSKVFFIDEMKDLDKLTIDELHGILTTYEMKTEKEKSSKREESFKASNKTKNIEHISRNIFDNESDAMEAHFLRKLKKRS